MHRRRGLYLSLTFAVVMLLILLAGADQPPPPGFVVVLPILAGMVALGTFLIPTWWQVFERHGFTRAVLVAIGEGAVLGFLVSGAFWMFSEGEPSVSPTVASIFLGITVVTVTGALVGGIVGAVSVAARPRAADEASPDGAGSATGPGS